MTPPKIIAARLAPVLVSILAALTVAEYWLRSNSVSGGYRDSAIHPESQRCEDGARTPKTSFRSEKGKHE
ncbi:MAG: hypothetical protein OEM62_09340 [Acidobacteriota bacterium]|nr:hypothetical protein [Acidobacteriota bacterium]